MLREELPEGLATHSVVLPTKPDALHRSLEAGDEPADTMVFVNHYRAGELSPNPHGTVGVLLTAPADGGHYDIDHPFVRREVERVSAALGLDRPITDLLDDHVVLDPEYYGTGVNRTGRSTGPRVRRGRAARSTGPRTTTVAALVAWWRIRILHPGGGIPAVVGGAMIATTRLLRSNPA